MSERERYAVVGAAMRTALAGARDADLTLTDHKVLGAVIGLVASYSRLVDRVSQREVAEFAGCSLRQARRSLTKLGSLRIVIYEGGDGRGNRSTVGLPKADNQVGHLSRAKGGQEEALKADRQLSERRTPTRARVDRGVREVREESGSTSENDVRLTAMQVLAAFSEVAGSDFFAERFTRQIAECVQEHPELSVAEHRKIVAHELAHPSWRWDTFTPSVIYSRPDRFEQAMHRWRVMATDPFAAYDLSDRAT